jgi:hypothetical protein
MIPFQSEFRDPLAKPPEIAMVRAEFTVSGRLSARPAQSQ